MLGSILGALNFRKLPSVQTGSAPSAAPISIPRLGPQKPEGKQLQSLSQHREQAARHERKILHNHLGAALYLLTLQPVEHGFCVYCNIWPKISHKQKDPTEDSFWNPFLSWALQPECGIPMFCTTLSHTIYNVPNYKITYCISSILVFMLSFGPLLKQGGGKWCPEVAARVPLWN